MAHRNTWFHEISGRGDAEVDTTLRWRDTGTSASTPLGSPTSPVVFVALASPTSTTITLWTMVFSVTLLWRFAVPGLHAMPLSYTYPLPQVLFHPKAARVWWSKKRRKKTGTDTGDLHDDGTCADQLECITSTRWEYTEGGSARVLYNQHSLDTS